MAYQLRIGGENVWGRPILPETYASCAPRNHRDTPGTIVCQIIRTRMCQIISKTTKKGFPILRVSVTHRNRQAPQSKPRATELAFSYGPSRLAMRYAKEDRTACELSEQNTPATHGVITRRTLPNRNPEDNFACSLTGRRRKSA